MLPVGTFGYEFARHALSRGISPNPVETMPAPDDGDWLMAYMYETHDLWHVLTGFYYNIEGEFGVELNGELLKRVDSLRYNRRLSRAGKDN